MTQQKPGKNIAQNDEPKATPRDLPGYTSPTVTVYEEDELLKTVAVLGCSPF